MKEVALKNARSSRLAERAGRVIPGGVNSATRRMSFPFTVDSAKGAYIRDVDGNEFLDYHASFGPIVLGHNDPLVNQAVVQATRGVDLVGVGVTEMEIEFAEKAVQHIPAAESVLTFSTGTEATYMAVRLSRGITGRKKLIKFQGCFHGWHDYLLMNIISPPELIGKSDPGSAGQLQEAIENTIVLPFNDLDSVERSIKENPDDIAAIFLEPIPHNIGCVLPTQAFMQGLRDICDQHGVVLVFDEVVTGFRHALGGYQSLVGVTPDLTTMAKAIANGYPCALLGGRKDYMDHFNTVPGGKVFIGGTYNGHPVGLAAALATIEALEDGSKYRRMFELGERLRSGIQDCADRLGVRMTAAGFGSIVTPYFMDGAITKFDDLLRNDNEKDESFRKAMIDRGIFMMPLPLKRNHISAVHTAEDIDRTIQVAEDVLRDMR